MKQFHLAKLYVGTTALALAGVSSAQTFGPQQVIASGNPPLSSPSWAFAHDVTGDGVADVVCCDGGSNRVWIFRNQGSGSFDPAQGLPSHGARIARPLDYEGDGDQDIAVAGADSVRVHLNAGPQGWGVVNLGPSGDNRDIDVGDIDGDGDLDVLIASYGDGRFLWFEKNSGSANLHVLASGPSAAGAHAARLVDVDGDGDLDVVTGSHSGSPRLGWLRNEGGGAFASIAQLAPFAGRVDSIEVTDVDADGDPDVLVTDSLFDRFGVIENLGGGAFEQFETLGDVHEATHLAAKPVNADRYPDVLVAGRAESQFSYYATSSLGDLIAPENLGAPSSIPVSVAFGDINADGVLDALTLSEGDRMLSWHAGLTYDCNVNGVPDTQDILSGTSTDCDGNSVPDECDLTDPSNDWDADGQLDSCPGGSAVYCDGNLNAAGLVGRIVPQGSPLVADDTFTLYANDLPVGQPGMFIMSRASGYVNPFGGGAGVLCLGPPIRRFNPTAGFPLQFTGTTGEITLTPHIAQFPGPNPIQPGDVIYFQLWHRENDPNTGVPRSNTTDGISVMFR